MQPPPNHVAMMQIDCEVVNTKLLYIKEDAIPLHMMAAHHHDMMNNNSGKGQENKSVSEGDEQYQYNASIEHINNASNEPMIDVEYNRSSYYHSGYNLSYLNIRNGGNNGNESLLGSVNVSVPQEEEGDKEQNYFPNDNFSNNSIDHNFDEGEGLIMDELDSANLILQRSPGIVPRRFNKNAKVRDPGSVDGMHANQSSNHKRHKKFPHVSMSIP